MVIPEHPHKKQLEGISSLDQDVVHQIIFYTSIIQLPVILSAVVGTFVAVTLNTAIKQDENIGGRKYSDFHFLN